MSSFSRRRWLVCKVRTKSRLPPDNSRSPFFFSLEGSVFDLFDKLLSRCIRTMGPGPSPLPSFPLLFSLSPLVGNRVCAGDRIGSASWEKNGKIEGQDEY